VAGQPFAVGNSPVASVIDGKGTHLYVLDAGSSAISAYDLNSTSGAPTQLTGSPFSITGSTTDPKEIVIDPSGMYLYLVSQNYNSESLGAVTAFSIDSSTGALTEFSTAPYSASNGVSPFAIALYKIP
jgi:6-phosphogluconolactonase